MHDMDFQIIHCEKQFCLHNEFTHFILCISTNLPQVRKISNPPEADFIFNALRVKQN